MVDVGAQAAAYDGVAVVELARRLDLPRIIAFDAVGSTMDAAHELGAQGAAAGSLVLAELQLAARGRGGRRWAAERDRGIWMTILERPTDSAALKVLSLRVGLALAAVLDRYTSVSVQLKWPNDLYIRGGKVAGILVEARWKEQRVDWVAIGVGINLRTPDGVRGAAALDASNAARAEMLGELVPALRAAAAARGSLTSAELARYAERDLAMGRLATEPARGRVAGIDAEGHLVLVGDAGEVRLGSGSLVLEDAIA